MNIRMSAVVKSAFETAFDKISWMYQFNPAWRMPNGFLNPEIQTTLTIGQMAKAYDPMTGEKIIFLGTRLGTVKVYLTDIGVIADAPFVLRAMMPFGVIHSFHDFTRFINPTNLVNNISQEVEYQFNAINAFNQYNLRLAA